MNERDAFIRGIAANLYDDAPRVAFADWLDERGGKADRARAEFIRLQCELATLPDDHDVILLSHVLHSFNEAHNHDILRKCYQALPSNGTLVISELLVDDDKTGPAPAALMSLTMLVGAEPGARNYTGAEYHAWLTAAGFHHIEVRRVQAPGANGIVIAHKP